MEIVLVRHPTDAKVTLAVPWLARPGGRAGPAGGPAQLPASQRLVMSGSPMFGWKIAVW
jgi:hypothetical protein